MKQIFVIIAAVLVLVGCGSPNGSGGGNHLWFPVQQSYKYNQNFNGNFKAGKPIPNPYQFTIP